MATSAALAKPAIYPPHHLVRTPAPVMLQQSGHGLQRPFAAADLQSFDNGSTAASLARQPGCAPRYSGAALAQSEPDQSGRLGDVQRPPSAAPPADVSIVSRTASPQTGATKRCASETAQLRRHAGPLSAAHSQISRPHRARASLVTRLAAALCWAPRHAPWSVGCLVGGALGYVALVPWTLSYAAHLLFSASGAVATAALVRTLARPKARLAVLAPAPRHATHDHAAAPPALLRPDLQVGHEPAAAVDGAEVAQGAHPATVTDVLCHPFTTGLASGMLAAAGCVASGLAPPVTAAAGLLAGLSFCLGLDAIHARRRPLRPGELPRGYFERALAAAFGAAAAAGQHPVLAGVVAGLATLAASSLLPRFAAIPFATKLMRAAAAGACASTASAFAGVNVRHLRQALTVGAVAGGAAALTAGLGGAAVAAACMVGATAWFGSTVAVYALCRMGPTQRLLMASLLGLGAVLLAQHHGVDAAAWLQRVFHATNKGRGV